MDRNDDAERLRPQRDVVAGRRADDDDWATTDRRLTFGYVDTHGQWVPGILEQIRNLSEDSKRIMQAQTEDRDRARLYDKWTLRIILIVIILRFIGLEHITDLAKMFGVHA